MKGLGEDRAPEPKYRAKNGIKLKSKPVEMCGPFGVLWRIKVRFCRHDYPHPHDVPSFCQLKVCPHGCFRIVGQR